MSTTPEASPRQRRARRTRPTVDVVIPCYNYARFLPTCVASVLDQPGVDVRVLVIDDHSPDDTPDVLARLMDADGRVEGRRHETNQGHIATYNEGLLDWARADYVVLLSADDLLAAGALARAADLLERHPDMGMVYSRGVYFSDHDRLPLTPRVPLGTVRWPGLDWIGRRCRSGRNVISSPEVVVRTSVQQAVGGYRPDLPHAGDLEMWLRIAAVSAVGYVRGRPGAYYRVHPQSMFRTRFGAALDDLQQRHEVFQRFFADHPDLPGRDRLQRQASRALARDALWRAVRGYDRDRLDVVPADELTEFALATYPDAGGLPEFAALRRRIRLGARLCHRTQAFVLSHVAKQATNRLRKQAWKWLGE